MSARRPWLAPLVPLYHLGVGTQNLLREQRMTAVRRLAKPVVSIGSLSAGGAGKTPVVIVVARLLAGLGVRVDVLSRGYGRTSKEILEVDSAGPASRFGDEPIEIAKALYQDEIPVFVGASRFLAGRLAEAAPNAAAAHLLDDGMQHRELHRDLEIVVLTAEDVADMLLPAGNLREPLSALARADVVVLREEEAAELRAVVAWHSLAETWVIRRRLIVEKPFSRPFVFSAIARPQNFLDLLSRAGYPAAGSRAFPDHHPYRDADIRRIVAEARAVRADGFYLTRKDRIKITPAWMAQLEAVAPVHAPELAVSLLETKHAVQRLRWMMRDA